jgi:peroxiredoxin
MTFLRKPLRLNFYVAGILVLLIVAAVTWYRLDIYRTLPKTFFILLSGEKIETAELHGKVVVVHFWATSCASCVKEMPKLSAFYKHFQPQGMEMIAVAMSYDPPMYVMNFAQTRQLPFKVAMDSSGHAAEAFGKVQITPATFVINKQGKIIQHYLGEPDWSHFQRTVQQALAS